MPRVQTSAGLLRSAGRKLLNRIERFSAGRIWSALCCLRDIFPADRLTIRNSRCYDFTNRIYGSVK